MATTAKARMKAQREEDLRDKLKSHGHVGQIIQCINWLGHFVDGEVRDQQCRKDLGVNDPVEKRLRLDAVKTRIDTHMKMLAKLLPDLKAVELTDNQERNFVISAKPLTEDEWQATYCEDDMGSASGSADITH